jgi:hypothetical protein
MSQIKIRIPIKASATMEKKKEGFAGDVSTGRRFNSHPWLQERIDDEPVA